MPSGPSQEFYSGQVQYARVPVVEQVRPRNVQLRPETLNHHIARYKFATTVQTPSGRALDVCCGTGYGTEILRVAGYDAFGFDISAEAIREAKANYPLCGFEVAEAVTHDYGKTRLVTFFEAIEHLLREDGMKSVRKAEQSLESGIFVVSTPRDSRLDHNPHHKSQWELDELRDVLGSIFTTVDILGQDWKTGSITGIDVSDRAFYIAVCTKKSSDNS